MNGLNTLLARYLFQSYLQKAVIKKTEFITAGKASKTTSVDINNTPYKRIQSLIPNHMPMCAVSLLESREQRYIKAVNNNITVLQNCLQCSLISDSLSGGTGGLR